MTDSSSGACQATCCKAFTNSRPGFSTAESQKTTTSSHRSHIADVLTRTCSLSSRSPASRCSPSRSTSLQAARNSLKTATLSAFTRPGTAWLSFSRSRRAVRRWIPEDPNTPNVVPNNANTPGLTVRSRSESIIHTPGAAGLPTTPMITASSRCRQLARFGPTIRRGDVDLTAEVGRLDAHVYARQAVAVVSAADHAQGCRPGAGPEGLTGGVQGGGPDTFEQGTDLLDLTGHLDDQLLAAGAEVTQPAPDLVDRFGDIAAKLRGQPGDQHRAFLVGLVVGEVLRRAGTTRSSPVGHRRTACPGSAASWPSTRHRCPVGSQATVTAEKSASLARRAAQSSAVPRSQARQRKVLRASTFES
ncbi:hypothetical protein SAMN04489730_8352 [Amycolatopsis australiensis]|uniref:Uncharacterized protein n=1 Tax=Amycolatopsis australiensis TaxID=546364 RepID=A0A1K1T652_9PSEU|nr:hypothetical protein SAMN04489730_8352 [Amycolatopsis australiensis]